MTFKAHYSCSATAQNCLFVQVPVLMWVLNNYQIPPQSVRSCQAIDFVPNTSIFSPPPLIVSKWLLSRCTELVCTHGHVSARSGGPQWSKPGLRKGKDRFEFAAADAIWFERWPSGPYAIQWAIYGVSFTLWKVFDLCKSHNHNQRCLCAPKRHSNISWKMWCCSPMKT